MASTIERLWPAAMALAGLGILGDRVVETLSEGGGRATEDVRMVNTREP